jgi:hypothetical protein
LDPCSKFASQRASRQGLPALAPGSSKPLPTNREKGTGSIARHPIRGREM